MKIPDSEPLFVYSWSSRGNLGDDWIHSVAYLVLENVVSVYEKRSAWLFGAYSLSSVQKPRLKRGSKVILWGGGWLAGDQKNLKVFKRWSRHFKRHLRFYAFGIGMGPFDFFAERWSSIIAAINQPLFVRCLSDQKSGVGCQTQLAADVVFLDPRVSTSPHGKRKGTVFSLARYSPHWQIHNPSLTEERYREFVLRIQKEQEIHGPCTFVEFDSGRRMQESDSDYWSFLNVPVSRPNDIQEAISIFQNADCVIASRLHAGILGALVGAKVLALSYHHKFESLREIGVEVIEDFSAETFESSFAPRLANLEQIEAVRERARDQLEKLKFLLSLDLPID